MTEKNKGIKEHVKCSFCSNIAEAVLTMISDGEIKETAFCVKHIFDYKYGEYKFNIENECNDDYSEIPEYAISEKKKEKSKVKEFEKVKEFNSKVLLMLEEKMNDHVKNEEFDKAALMRDAFKKYKKIEEKEK